MAIYSVNHLKNTFLKSGNVVNRSFFYWVLDVFNSVDKKRINEIGPDRACAEWLLMNGAAVRWKGSTEYLKDYNILIKNDDTPKFIEAVDATESGIYYSGFGYFGGCQYLKEMILNKCVYVNDRALKRMHIVKDVLTSLEIQDNVYVTSKGLSELKVLQKLEKLTLADIKKVKDKASVQQELQEALPNCKVEFH